MKEAAAKAGLSRSQYDRVRDLARKARESAGSDDGSEAGATANLVARQRVRLAGWDKKKLAFRLNQETRNKKKEDALNKALDS